MVKCGPATGTAGLAGMGVRGSILSRVFITGAGTPEGGVNCPWAWDVSEKPKAAMTRARDADFMAL